MVRLNANLTDPQAYSLSGFTRGGIISYQFDLNSKMEPSQRIIVYNTGVGYNGEEGHYYVNKANHSWGGTRGRLYTLADYVDNTDDNTATGAFNFAYDLDLYMGTTDVMASGRTLNDMCRFVYDTAATTDGGIAAAATYRVDIFVQHDVLYVIDTREGTMYRLR